MRSRWHTHGVSRLTCGPQGIAAGQQAVLTPELVHPSADADGIETITPGLVDNAEHSRALLCSTLNYGAIRSSLHRHLDLLGSKDGVDLLVWASVKGRVGFIPSPPEALPTTKETYTTTAVTGGEDCREGALAHPDYPLSAEDLLLIEEEVQEQLALRQLLRVEHDHSIRAAPLFVVHGEKIEWLRTTLRNNLMGQSWE